MSKVHTRKLIILKGLPGSGKSTWAKEQTLKDKRTIRVNRDDIRQMVRKDYQFGDFKLEDLVTSIEQGSVIAALKQGFNVIVDSTGLNPKFQSTWTKIAEELAGYDYVVQVVVNDEFLKVPYETCVARDHKRCVAEQPWVGRSVITEIAFKFGLVPMTEKVVLCDIDGTVADISVRRKMADRSNGSMDWVIFNDPHYMELYDKPREDIIKQVNELHHSGYTVIMVSGRMGGFNDKTDVLEMTVHQLKHEWGLKFDHILMRKQGDNRSDVILKKEFLDMIGGPSKVLKVFDDRKCVIDMWRTHGIEVVVCDPNDTVNGGDF